jgi:hypothetical protein
VGFNAPVVEEVTVRAADHVARQMTAQKPVDGVFAPGVGALLEDVGCV